MFRLTTPMRAMGGINMPSNRPEPKAYRSPYAPKYTIGRHLYGFNGTKLNVWITGGGLFAGALGVAAVFFTTGVPKVRDIMVQLPIVGEFFRHEVAPEDNPF